MPQIPSYWEESNLFNTSFENGSTNGSFLVEGNVKQLLPNSTVKYLAANPPDFRTSYAGSGLPFPNPEIAYEGTPNRGIVKAVNGRFSFRIQYPNSLYINQSTQLLMPHVLIMIEDSDSNETEMQVINLGESIPHRTLTSSSNTLGLSRNSAERWELRRDVSNN